MEGLPKSPSSRPTALFNSSIFNPVIRRCAMKRERQFEGEECVRTPLVGRQKVPLTIIDLEVSKPQKNTRPAEGRGGRSRSPDAYRGVVSPRSRGFGRDRDMRDREPRGGSHYVGSAARGGRETRDVRDVRDYRERDEYRRSPPPRFRGRDDYRPTRDRSRSRTPPGRFRSRSPPPDRFAPRVVRCMTSRKCKS